MEASRKSIESILRVRVVEALVLLDAFNQDEALKGWDFVIEKLCVYAKHQGLNKQESEECVQDSLTYFLVGGKAGGEIKLENPTLDWTDDLEVRNYFLNKMKKAMPFVYNNKLRKWQKITIESNLSSGSDDSDEESMLERLAKEVIRYVMFKGPLEKEVSRELLIKLASTKKRKSKIKKAVIDQEAKKVIEAIIDKELYENSHIAVDLGISPERVRNAKERIGRRILKSEKAVMEKLFGSKDNENGFFRLFNPKLSKTDFLQKKRAYQPPHNIFDMFPKAQQENRPFENADLDRSKDDMYTHSYPRRLSRFTVVYNFMRGCKKLYSRLFKTEKKNDESMEIVVSRIKNNLTPFIDEVLRNPGSDNSPLFHEKET